MSGLIVRPGDVLVVPVAPPSTLRSGERERMKHLIEADMPGVTVVVAEGIAGGPFVYRPDPTCTHEEWQQRVSVAVAADAPSNVDSPHCIGEVIDGVCDHDAPKSTTVYVAVVEDTHADTDPQVFTDGDDAIAWAQLQAKEGAREPDDIEVMNLSPHYEYYASYSPESKVWVVKRNLDDPANMSRVKFPESPEGLTWPT
jgi:hypothetical protein